MTIVVKERLALAIIVYSPSFVWNPCSLGDTDQCCIEKKGCGKKKGCGNTVVCELKLILWRWQWGGR